MNAGLDPKSWALMAEARAKRMFSETENPFYVIEAITAARTAGWRIPEWALECLLDAVSRSYWNSLALDKISIDDALGLQAKRGGTLKKVRAHRDDMEGSVFDDIFILKHCFKLSIEKACELVFNEVDFRFGSQMKMSIFDGCEITDDALKKSGMTRKFFDETNSQFRKLAELHTNSPLNSAAVNEKLAARKFFHINTGDRLGYGIDRLIERYQKPGGKLAKSKWAEIDDNEDRSLCIHIRGWGLLKSNVYRYSGIEYIPKEYVCKGMPIALQRKPDFEKFLTTWQGGWK